MENRTGTEISKTAEELFNSGFFCAESVLLAIARTEGIESALIPGIATAFCSGMARSCGTCGALTGALLGVSLVLGRARTEDSAQPAYDAARQVIREFERTFGSRECQALLDGCDLGSEEGKARFDERQLKDRCRRYTAAAAGLAAAAIVGARGSRSGPGESDLITRHSAASRGR